MPPPLLPLFPLQVVVFPRMRLPLHIFEDRYKAMVGEAIRDRSEFGIVLGKEDGVVNAGCTVTVEKVLQMYPDGKMDIVTRGNRRFEIQSLDEEKDYLRAEVEYFDDEDFVAAPPELRQAALKQHAALVALATEPPEGAPDTSDPQLSFQLAPAVPDLDFLCVLLRSRSESDRLRRLVQYLDDYLPRRRTIEHVKQVAPTNGHGGRTPQGL